MTWSVVTPPTSEPILLAAAKLHLRVDGIDDNDLITALITAARVHVETVCERAILSQEWMERQPAFPKVIELRGGQVTAVASLKYRDADGAIQTMAPADYVADMTTQPATITAAYGTEWPSVQEGLGAVQVVYTVGYADGEVPAPLTAAMLLIIGDLYGHRTGKTDVKLQRNPAVASLLFPYKRVVP